MSISTDLLSMTIMRAALELVAQHRNPMADETCKIYVRDIREDALVQLYNVRGVRSDVPGTPRRPHGLCLDHPNRRSNNFRGIAHTYSKAAQSMLTKLASEVAPQMGAACILSYESLEGERRAKAPKDRRRGTKAVRRATTGGGVRFNLEGLELLRTSLEERLRVAERSPHVESVRYRNADGSGDCYGRINDRSARDVDGSSRSAHRHVPA